MYAHCYVQEHCLYTMSERSRPSRHAYPRRLTVTVPAPFCCPVKERKRYLPRLLLKSMNLSYRGEVPRGGEEGGAEMVEKACERTLGCACARSHDTGLSVCSVA